MKIQNIFFFSLITFFSCNVSEKNTTEEFSKNDRNQDSLNELSFDILNPCSNEIDLNELGWYIHDTTFNENDGCKIYFTTKKELYDKVEIDDVDSQIKRVTVKDENVKFDQEFLILINYSNPSSIDIYPSEKTLKHYYDTSYIDTLFIKGVNVYFFYASKDETDTIKQQYFKFSFENKNESLTIYFLFKKGKNTPLNFNYNTLNQIIDRFIVQKKSK